MPKAKNKPRRKRIRAPWLLAPEDTKIQYADIGEEVTALTRASALSLRTGVIGATVCELSGIIELQTANGACITARVERAVMPPAVPPYRKTSPKVRRLKDLRARLEDGVWVLRWNYVHGTALGDGFSDTPTVREVRDLLKKSELNGDDQHDIACSVAKNSIGRLPGRTPYAWQTSKAALQVRGDIERVFAERRLHGKERV